MVDGYLQAAEEIAEQMKDQPGPSTPSSRSSSRSSSPPRQVASSFSGQVLSKGGKLSSEYAPGPLPSQGSLLGSSASSASLSSPQRAQKQPDPVETALPSTYGGSTTHSDAENSDDEHHHGRSHHDHATSLVTEVEPSIKDAADHNEEGEGEGLLSPHWKVEFAQHLEEKEEEERDRARREDREKTQQAVEHLKSTILEDQRKSEEFLAQAQQQLTEELEKQAAEASMVLTEIAAAMQPLPPTTTTLVPAAAPLSMSQAGEEGPSQADQPQVPSPSHEPLPPPLDSTTIDKLIGHQSMAEIDALLLDPAGQTGSSPDKTVTDSQSAENADDDHFNPHDDISFGHYGGQEAYESDIDSDPDDEFAFFPGIHDQFTKEEGNKQAKMTPSALNAAHDQEEEEITGEGEGKLAGDSNGAVLTSSPSEGHAATFENPQQPVSPLSLLPVVASTSASSTSNPPGHQEIPGSAPDVDGEEIKTKSRSVSLVGLQESSTRPLAARKPSSSFSGSPTLPASRIPARSSQSLDLPSSSSSSASFQHPAVATTGGEWVFPTRWMRDSEAPQCLGCSRSFSFLIRKHHCRKCGKIYCDQCSSRVFPHRGKNMRVCDTCYLALRTSSPASPSPPPPLAAQSSSPPSAMADFPDQIPANPFYDEDEPALEGSDSFMEDCPKCGMTFKYMRGNPLQMESHLNECFSQQSLSQSAFLQRRRYLIQRLSKAAVGEGGSRECPICFEDFEADQEVATLDCLCRFHRHCIEDWFSRGNGCPVHQARE